MTDRKSHFSMVTEGFLTGTFDTPHPDHFRMLQFCFDRCDRLVVGLTTDEQVQKEKGHQPLLNYEERRCILENSKWVHCVIPNHGESKLVMYRRLRCQVVFVGEEYQSHPHTRELEQASNGPKIYIVPRGTGHSSTSIRQRVAGTALQIHAFGGLGPILNFGGDICKFVHIGQPELGRTSDVFGISLMDELPRNVFGAQPKFPNLSGYNANREVLANRKFQGRPWNPFICAHLIWASEEKKVRVPSTKYSLQQIVTARQFPAQVQMLVLRAAGVPYGTWCRQADYKSLRLVQANLRTIVREVHAAGYIHGDLHINNVLVGPDLQVSLIDWGWCQSYDFEMGARELSELEWKLMSEQDLIDFQTSCATAGCPDPNLVGSV